MRRQYQERYETARRELDRIAEQYPAFINDLQGRLGQRLALLAKSRSILQQAEGGTLPTEVAENMLNEISGELRNLRGYQASGLKLEPVELVRRWPPLQSLPPEDLASIAIRMRPQPVGEREVVMKQGEPSDCMYFIAHGVVRLSREENGASRDMATFMAGDFFGEGALLGGEPYGATATAVTRCSLYRLERMDLEVAIANSPIIREALEKNHHTETGPISAEDRLNSK
jgi:CPA1 family monovalent cation:H+ antiporter